MSSFVPADFGPVIAQLLEIDRCRALDAGEPSKSVLATLRDLEVASAFAHTKVSDERSARCCLSAVWLLHDFLDESHTISQGVATFDGSFWHGIMHRREGDFSNAKYWFRKVGDHPVYAQLSGELAALDAGLPGLEQHWDPFDFVDACQAAIRSGGAAEEQCRLLQQREWELLFEHCYRGATD